MTLTDFQYDVIEGLLEMESELPNSFTYIPTSISYPCIASITEMSRALATGGFTIDRTLTMTVRLYDLSGNKVFTNGEPETQKIVELDGKFFRIISKKHDATKSHIRLICFGIQRGQ